MFVCLFVFWFFSFTDSTPIRRAKKAVSFISFLVIPAKMVKVIKTASVEPELENCDVQLFSNCRKVKICSALTLLIKTLVQSGSEVSRQGVLLRLAFMHTVWYQVCVCVCVCLRLL